MTGQVRIVDYDARWREDFARLNLEWLERWFTVEPIDRAVLGDPEASILAHGGRVLYAVDADDHALGTVALKHEGDGVYELTKMAVAPEERGTGVGRLLVDAAIAAYLELDGRELFLESSQKLQPALRLYESAGFVHQPGARPGSPYARADVHMVWSPPPA
jgi:ribosomal protein S18 acetylase RimI-like enzyme